MLNGREAASRGLTAARDGDTIIARGAFHEAARTFAQARDKLESPLLSGGLAVPGVASNVKAARTLAEIGTDLADAGESVTTAVDPEALEVVDGRLPLEEVVKVTPELRRGSSALTNALAKLDDVRDDPYLAQPVEEAVDKIHAQLAQAEREARHAAAAAQLAPALFGGDGHAPLPARGPEQRRVARHRRLHRQLRRPSRPRTASSRSSELVRTGVWNAALRERAEVTWASANDYRARYTQFLPATTLQNVNLSPDFPLGRRSADERSHRRRGSARSTA